MKTAVAPVHDGELPVELTQSSALRAPLDAARGEEVRPVENEMSVALRATGRSGLRAASGALPDSHGPHRGFRAHALHGRQALAVA